MKMKKWFEKVVEVIIALNFTFVATTIESDFTLPYIACLVIALATMGVGTYLIVNYGRDGED